MKRREARLVANQRSEEASWMAQPMDFDPVLDGRLDLPFVFAPHEVGVGGSDDFNLVAKRS